MLFKKPKLFCKTQHQTKPKRQHNKLRHKLSHQLRLMKFLWRFVNFIFSVLCHVFRSGFRVLGLLRFHASVLFCPPGFNVCHFSCGLCGPFCNFYLFVVCPALNVSPLCGLCGLCFSLPCFYRLPRFRVGFAGHFVIFYIVCPAFDVFVPFVGFTGYIWFGFVSGPACNVCSTSCGFSGQF